MRRIRSGAAVCLSVAVLAAGCVGTGSDIDSPEAQERMREAMGDSATTSDAAGQQRTPEHMLAGIHERTQSPAPATVRRFGERLDRAETKCREDRLAIADIVVGATQLAAEQGLGSASWTLDDWLAGIDTGIPAEAAPMSCAEVVATLMVLGG